MADLLHKKRKLTSFQIIILGFAGVILVGALLLMLPISTKSGSDMVLLYPTRFDFTEPHSARKGYEILC